MITSARAAKLIVGHAPETCHFINTFSESVLRTRGGRLGSGMGSLIEALWGYYMNQVLENHGIDCAECEIGWLVGHEYNDFACVCRNLPWNQDTREGELLRIEAKSMNLDVDESKGHFDEIRLGKFDLLLVILWQWASVDEQHVYPKIIDQFIGNAISVARMRDALHTARGGAFVDKNNCPDGCSPAHCRHDGEPLNANGKRERLEGPGTRRPSQNTSYANNFGGLVRMLKTDSELARTAFRRFRRDNDVAHAYISFVHRNFPSEEFNQYTIDEWRTVASQTGVQSGAMKKSDLVQVIRTHDMNYREKLRLL